jgi:hypothetical protein
VARAWASAIALVGLLAVMGCSDNTTNTVVAPPVDAVPYVVDGVYSVTGDLQVTVYWRPNQESDINHYNVYRNFAQTGTFTLVGSAPGTSFIDGNVVNGTTYYYAVTAVDNAGQESPQLSYENVFDTPRPEGFNVSLTNSGTAPLTSGWDFSAALVRSSPPSLADIYYDTSGGVFLVLAAPGVDIQDAGYVPLVDVDFAPPAGWSPDRSVEAIVGHSYLVFTADNHYAKFEVTAATANGMTMDWAYQIAPGNPELARKLP